ncbi:MAG: hypothetical protein KKH75_06920, partial [Actinobacteria bacterium]|nr:hypothetical protein [Actinomycetota bacterium]
EPTVLGQMQAQLQASLATAGISAVRMSYSGATLQTTPASTQPTTVDQRALVLNSAGFGFLSGSDLAPVAGIGDAISTLTSPPTSIELSSDQSFAAVELASGRVGRVQSDRKWLEFDARPNLIAPTVDPQGFMWSVPTDSPTGLTVFSPAGEPSAVSGWSSATKITAMQLSRDGTRMAAIATVGGRSVIWLAGVVRSADGLPKSLGQPVVLATLPGAGIDLAWLDDTTLGVLANDGDSQVMIEQQVGGPSRSMPTPAGETMTDIAGANQPTGVRLRDATGTLYVRRGANWGSAATAITVLGTQQ